MPTARAVTGIAGDRLVMGFDKNALFVDNMGERILNDNREVTYRGTFKLRDVLYTESGKNVQLFERFSMLANRVRDDIKDDSVDVDLLSCGKIKEIRIGKKRWRAYGSLFKRMKT